MTVSKTAYSLTAGEIVKIKAKALKEKKSKKFLSKKHGAKSCPSFFSERCRSEIVAFTALWAASSGMPVDADTDAMRSVLFICYYVWK